ncbi:MAG: histidine kinase [Deltaproteobacteria bacterium]|nr:histidine kinase [Deltaproteobacteria bacterium]MBL7112698.1 histidine kinase [Bacteroidales bacterium]
MKWISSKIRRQILLSPFLLAIPFTLLIIVLLPDLFPKFRSELIEKGFIDKPGGYEYWEDIDHDGNSERIVLFNNTEGKASVKIIEENGYIGDHYYCRGKYIVIKTLPVKTGNDWKLVSLLYKIAPGNYSPRLILTTVQGEVITVRGLGDTLERPAMDIFFIGQDREYIYLSGQHGQIEKIHDFSSPLYLDLPASIESRFVQIKTPESGRSTIAIQQAGIYYHYSYEKNRFYFLKFPFYMGIYVFILGFIHLIRRLQQVQLEQRKKLSDEITALQLKSIKSQFDPHLTFNIMTSISYAVHQGNKELANQFIARFSAFIRDIVTDSDQISRTLGNELTFVTRYL